MGKCHNGGNVVCLCFGKLSVGWTVCGGNDIVPLAQKMKEHPCALPVGTLESFGPKWAHIPNSKYHWNYGNLIVQKAIVYK